MTPEERLELLLDLVAEELIKSVWVSDPTTEVLNAQKFIINGQLQQGAGAGVLALFQKDIKANEEDLQITTTDQNGEPIPTIQNIANNIDFDTLVITVSQGPIINITDNATYANGLEITEYIFGDNNPLNVSQFIPLQQSSSIVDVERANEYLDTNIFELLPTGDTRQARIIRFFQELNALLPPTIETEQWDEDNDGNVDRLIDGTWSGAEQYSQDNSISYAQDNPDESNIGEEDAFIHRLKDTANDTNSSRTIEDIYNTVRPYLRDILEDTPGLEGLPEYENQSSGYLKFRNLNQGIIVRNTNEEFVKGLDPSNPTYLDTGFTITMWVRFLDKVSTGTLFNFGNPTRNQNPFGFKLETYVLNKNDDYASESQTRTWGEVIEEGTFQVGPGYDERIFKDSDVARFVRLQVREFGNSTTTGDDLGLRDSHVGLGGDLTLNGNVIADARKSYNVGDFNNYGNDELRLLQSTYIPEDFNEWYFICATYNPNVDEENSDFNNTNPDYWLNHVEADGESYTSYSGLGNKCKVEIISRSDLLRARGFNT